MTPPDAGGSEPGGPGLVCKVGGSLLDGGWAPDVVAALARVAPRTGALLLAGGGAAADRVRARHRRGEMDEEEAHWSAVAVLDGTAFRLAGGCGRELPVTAALPRRPREVAVLAPRALLRSVDPLPATWAVTSDSIAAWCAGRLGARDLLLLKARDGAPREGASPGSAAPRRVEAARAARDGLVDDHLPAVLAGAAVRAWTLDGRHPRRLLRWATGDPAAATRIVAR